jgi:hypothetical protein
MVNKKDSYDKLKKIAGYNGFMIDAPNYIIILSDEKKGYLENSGYIGEKIKLKARDLGIDSCWITINDGNAVKRALNLSTNKLATAIIGIGYEDDTYTKNKTIAQRLNVEEIVYIDTWGNNANADILEERNLLEAFNYARMAPSTLNRQPWRFILDGEKVILTIKDDDFTTDYEIAIETGIAMLYFGLIIDITMFDLKWHIGKFEKNYNIPNENVMVGYCSI